MNFLPQLAAIAGVMLLACASPGPDMLAVTSHAFARRRAGLFTAAGIATSHALWATLAVFGLGLILAQIAWLYEGIHMAGAVYLLYLGARILLSLRQGAGAAEPTAAAKQTGAAHAYRRGLLVGLTNPKAAAFFGSLFVTLLPAHAPMWVHGATVATVAGVSICWFSAMALLFSTDRVQRGYRKLRRPIDAVMGAVLVGIGARLALDH